MTIVWFVLLMCFVMAAVEFVKIVKENIFISALYIRVVKEARC